MKKIISVVGARPNFMKVAPVHKEFLKHNKIIKHLVCHTGQHYDKSMSKIFFKDLKLPEPDFYLGVGSGSHAEQTARIMIEFEKILIKEKPDAIIVVGDVNSTIACSLVASKMNIKIAHIEAGLRSFDRTMPEEINRILTDSISDFLFVTEKSGLENLKREGVSDEKIFFTGNVMIDSLISFLPDTEKSNVLQELNLELQNYVLVTLHRPSNVDSIVQFEKLFKLLIKLSLKNKIVFPAHPRTKKNLYNFISDIQGIKNLIITEPLGYIDFLSLIKNAKLILTDSGGIQEESTYLGVQCLTLRNSTERPVTVEIGTNQLIGNNLEYAEKESFDIMNGKKKVGKVPDLWDGKAAERIVNILVNTL